MEPQTPPRQRLNRDQIVQIQTLRAIGHSYPEIARHLSVTERAVQYTCTRERPTPKKHTGRPSQLTTDETNDLIEYVTQSQSSKRESFFALS